MLSFHKLPLYLDVLLLLNLLLHVFHEFLLLSLLLHFDFFFFLLMFLDLQILLDFLELQHFLLVSQLFVLSRVEILHLLFQKIVVISIFILFFFDSVVFAYHLPYLHCLLVDF